MPNVFSLHAVRVGHIEVVQDQRPARETPLCSAVPRFVRSLSGQNDPNKQGISAPQLVDRYVSDAIELVGVEVVRHDHGDSCRKKRRL